eukprot:CAMPEP_0197846772 /NCGR_PEP_ID=MMETSP1438-20131217/4344_1 /TAXON_ID=1461541 /ORGANISM="Pterosperma sp., Strain CCMP1384" /LENGTH=125 /DNA_ID=CAMNT_0043458535 /DNA_START=384 /DNA_END=758 /DNA_ORIENTATION=-
MATETKVDNVSNVELEQLPKEEEVPVIVKSQLTVGEGAEVKVDVTALEEITNAGAGGESTGEVVKSPAVVPAAERNPLYRDGGEDDGSLEEDISVLFNDTMHTLESASSDDWKAALLGVLNPVTW